MYPTLREQLPGASADRTRPDEAAPRSRFRFGFPAVSRTVVFLGLTSFLTDISSEMVATILPLYLVLFLGLTPLQFGIIDGLYQGVSAFVRLAGGYFGDRFRRHKEVAATGYGLSAIAKVGLLAVGSAWVGIAAVIAVDRVGKGIRTAPRDALISLSSAKESLGITFGVHRAMDTAGAMLGPLIGFAILALIPNGFDIIFVVSACFAFAGLAALVTFVENHPTIGIEPSRAKVSLRRAFALLGESDVRRLVIAGGAVSLATVSDGFLFLALQNKIQLTTGLFPLLFVATAASYMILAVPVGRIADRFGRGRVFIAGYVVLLVAYAILLGPDVGPVSTITFLLLFGTYYAATDGVLMAMASVVVPEDLRSSGLALVTTVVAIARFGASILFGALWMIAGPETALVVFGTALAGAIGIAGLTLRARGNDARATA
jgi:MFS family permease